MKIMLGSLTRAAASLSGLAAASLSAATADQASAARDRPRRSLPGVDALDDGCFPEPTTEPRDGCFPRPQAPTDGCFPRSAARLGHRSPR